MRSIPNFRSGKELHIMRASGILMHISSLPSPYGIGTLGKEAYRFVDFLADAGQSYWQILPMNPTGFGDSPYQAFSTFAGNPYFIDLDVLMEEGWLRQHEVEAVQWGESPDKVDFEIMAKSRLKVLHKAYDRFICSPNRSFLRFLDQEKDWLREYGIFMALKSHFGGADWSQWDVHLRQHEEAALREATADLRYEITFHYFLQYEFYLQWNRLREYCRSKGIRLIGDVPIYVPYDSADVWSNPKLFQLDAEGTPTGVAGCPPDDFNEDGQLWGNPLYDWKAMKEDGYAWWLRRLRAAAKMYDVVRIDHFRGFESYWAVPYGASTARNGVWKKGPGLEFVQILRKKLRGLSFIAEDLGFLTPEVVELRKASGFPGMKVLEFAFDPREPSEYLPHTYEPNCVCYTGTHDNATVIQWYEELPEENRQFARRYLALTEEEGINWGVIRGGMSSIAKLFIAQMQDYLALPSDARMNEPGHINAQNWRWRMLPGACSEDLAEQIRQMTQTYFRLPVKKNQNQ